MVNQLIWLLSMVIYPQGLPHVTSLGDRPITDTINSHIPKGNR